MHNLEFALENEIGTILGDFKMQKHQLISTRRLSLAIVQKKKKKKVNLPNSSLCPFWLTRG